MTCTCSKPSGESKQKKAQESLFLSASWTSSCRYCGGKAWCIFHGEVLLPCLQRICTISSARSRMSCLQMRNPPLPFSHLLSVISGVSKAKETPENKKHWKCYFRPQKHFAVPDCQVHSQDTICICGQPSSLPQQLPRHFWARQDTYRTNSHHAGLCRGAQEAPGAGWMVSTSMLLHWRSWEDFPRGLDNGGAGDHRWQEEKEVLRTGDKAAAALKRQKQRCQWVDLAEGYLIYSFRNWQWFLQQFWPKLISYFQYSLGFWLCS